MLIFPSRCSLKILTEIFLLGNLTHTNAAPVARKKSLELLSSYDSTLFCSLQSSVFHISLEITCNCKADCLK